MSQDRERDRGVDEVEVAPASEAAPGKRTRSASLAVQSRAESPGGDGGRERLPFMDVMLEAQRGVSGGGGELPYRDQIQASFGAGHDLSGIRAHVGGDAAGAAQRIGAEAYATGNQVAFQRSPDLHTAAHEAAHVVQQQAGVQLKGGVGEVGDVYERQADAVADRVVAGRSAADLLGDGRASGAGSAVQLRRLPGDVGAIIGDPADDTKGGANYGAHQEGLLLLIERAMADLKPEERLEVERRTRGGMEMFEFVRLPPHEQLERKVRAILGVRPDLTLGDPNLINTGPRTGTDDKAHLEQLVKNAEKIFDEIAGGGHDAGLGDVFGKANVAAAKAKYAKGKTWMKKLLGDDKIVTDRSGYSAEVKLGGLTGFHRRISVGPGKIDNPDDAKSIVTMIHESMHAGNSDVKDKGYIHIDEFTKLSELEKLGNAAHFEVIPRRILGTDYGYEGVVFRPAGTTVDGVTEPAMTATEQAMRAAKEALRQAWTIGLNLHELWLQAYKSPSSWTTDRGGGVTLASGLPYWSKVEKLTVHNKTDLDPAGADLAKHPVSQIDMALSEGFTRRLSIAMNSVPKKEADVAAFEAPHSTEDERKAAHATVELHRDLLVKIVLVQPGVGPITGNAERDLRVVKELVGLDWGTVLDARNPADFAD